MILGVLLVLGPMTVAACGYSSALGEHQPVVTATGNTLERYATQPADQRPTPSSWLSSSQQSMPVDAASILAQMPGVPPTVACWATPSCGSILADFAYCYNLTGGINDPNADDGRSEIYQRCLCTDKGTMYKDIILNYGKIEQDNVTQCYKCMKQAGVDTDDINQPSIRLEWKIHDFCNTAMPNLYDLLVSFLAWLGSTNEPVNHDTHQSGGISAVSTLANRFTSTSGMNQPTRITSLPKSMQGSWSPGTPTSGYTLPTQYTEQLPKNWPYTAYGAATKAGHITSFPLTDASSTSATLAWLHHTVLWNPRPFFTPPSARNSMYQPSLRDWVPAFTDASALSMTTDFFFRQQVSVLRD